MTAAAAPAQRSAIGRLLDFVEVAGNKVPHPVMMFLYLIIGVIVLSQILYIAGVSVTDEIVVPDTIQVTPDYYEDTTYPSGPEGGDILANGFHLETVTIPIGACYDRGDPVHLHLVRVQLRRLRRGRGHVHRADGRRGRRGRRADGRADPKLVGASPKKLLSLILVLVGIMSSVASDAGYLILVPLGAAAFMSSGGTRSPAWRCASPPSAPCSGSTRSSARSTR